MDFLFNLAQGIYPLFFQEIIYSAQIFYDLMVSELINIIYQSGQEFPVMGYDYQRTGKFNVEVGVKAPASTAVTSEVTVVATTLAAAGPDQRVVESAVIQI